MNLYYYNEIILQINKINQFNNSENYLKMTINELFVRKIFDIASELKIPLITEKVYNKASFNSKNTIITILFKYNEDESVIKGFLGLANYYHVVVIQEKDKFYIPNGFILFQLESN